MDALMSKDGTQLYYKDWGRGPVVAFCHGWPLNSDAWDGQLHCLSQHGFRALAHDRRGHGRSEQATSGNDMNGYADDLSAVIETLGVRGVTLVGHSTGCGEIVRYLSRHGSRRIARIVLISTLTPAGVPSEDVEIFRRGLTEDRSQFYRDLALRYYGANRPDAAVTRGLLQQFWLWSMQSGLKNAHEGVKASSEADYSADLRNIAVPTLILHGEDDQISPMERSAHPTLRLIRGSTAITYPRAPHGLTATHQVRVNSDLLAFLRA